MFFHFLRHTIVLINLISFVDLSLNTHLGKSGDEEGKQKVAKIHELKEKLKQENEVLKKIKQNLKDVQDKQKVEKEVHIIPNMLFIWC